MNNKALTIINLFGVPSAGKSTVRSQIFGALKSRFVNIDEIQEVAKIKKSSGMSWALSEDQLGILADQNTLQLITKREGFELAITDSPLLLSAFYAPSDYLQGSFKNIVFETYHTYSNVNYFINNSFESHNKFFGEGRNHAVDWSIENQPKLKEFLESNQIKYKEFQMSDSVYLDIIEDLIFNKVI